MYCKKGTLSMRLNNLLLAYKHFDSNSPLSNIPLYTSDNL